MSLFSEGGGGMETAMIRAEGLGIRFDLGIEKGFSLKQGFVDLLDPAKRGKKRREEFWALRDVDLCVAPGEVVGLIGGNGAGKSTLLKLVAGVYKPSRGRVSVGGSVCPMIELGAGFDPELTARENIYLNGAVMGYDRAFLREAFLEVPVKNYSSGMTARLAFSVATVVEPEILIVDEILAVGDLAFQSKSEEKMLSMIRGGTTVLYVSQSLDSIRKLCSRTLWLEHGRTRLLGETQAVCDAYVAALRPGETL